MPYEKVGNNESVCIADEVPFEIPDSWEWVRLYNIGAPIDDAFADGPFGSNLKKEHYTDKHEVRLIQLSNIGEDGWKDSNIKYTTYEHAKTLSRSMVKPGCIVIAKMMPAGRAIIVPNLEKDYILSSDAVKFIPNDFINTEYLLYAINSPVYRNQVVAESHGVTRIRTSLGKLKTYLLPIPPLQEQTRIVKQIKSISPLIEKYEKKEAERQELDLLFPETLKKSILQQAVMGKLVPQDENDEPASVLLDKIHAEKASLIKAGKLKKDKHESIIYRRDNSHYEKIDNVELCIDGEIPFDIPDSWSWCRLSELVFFIGGYAYKSGDFINKSDYQVLRLGNVKNDHLRLDQKPVFITEQLAQSTDSFVCKKNDILLTMTGTRGKRDYFFTVKIINEKNLYINQRVGCLRSYIGMLSDWLIYALKSEFILSQVFEHETGTANQGNLGSESILRTLIPLPPEREQKRIVCIIKESLLPLNTL